MNQTLIRLIFVLTVSVISLQASCGRNPNCSKAFLHPGYDVSYAPEDWWSLEKHPSGIDSMYIAPRRYEGMRHHSMAVSPEQVAIVWNMTDCMANAPEVAYSHAAVIHDDLGEPHHIRLEWGSWYETKSRGFAFINKRQHVHYVRATIDNRLLFVVDDYVGDGLYEYEDFFRLGNRSFRLTVNLKSRRHNFDFASTLLAFTPSITEGEMKAPASPTPKTKAKSPVAKPKMQAKALPKLEK